MNLKNLEKLLKLSLFIGIFAVPLIVFIMFDGTYFPYITGKNFVFRVIVELLFGGWVMLAYLNKEYCPKISPILVSVLLFVSVVGIADFFGVNFEKSLWSNYERMEGYITTLHLLAYFVVLISFLKVQKSWDWLFNTMIFISCVMGFVGLGQLIESGFQGDRLATTLGNPIYLAVYMLFHIFITLYLLFREDIKKFGFRQYFYIFALVPQTINLYYTATRGTTIGLIGGLMLTAILIAVFEKERKFLRKMAIGSLGFIIIFIGLFISFKETPFIKNSPVLNRFATMEINTGTVGARFKIWNVAYQGFKERPILGYGQENFTYVFNKYYSPNLYSEETWFDRAHNVFFDWLVAAGIFGLASYLLIFVATLYQLWKKKENDFSIVGKSILTGLLAAYFVHNIFVFDNLISYILFFTVIAYINFRSINSSFDRLQKIKLFSQAVGNKIDNSKKDVAVPLSIFIITLALVYSVNYAPYIQNKILIQALQQYPESPYKNFDLFKEALSYDSFGNTETVERLLTQAISIEGQQTDQEIKNSYRDLAIEESKKQIENNPGDARYPLLSSYLFSSFGNYDEAIKIAEKAREISPSKQVVLFSLGSIYHSKGEYDKSLAVYKEAYDLAPDYEEAVKRYGLAALSAGDEELAKEILFPVYGTYFVPDASYLNFFAGQKRFDAVEEVLKGIIKKDPSQKQYYFQLVGTYVQLDKRDKALEVLESIDTLFPDLKETADYYINEINSGNI